MGQIDKEFIDKFNIKSQVRGFAEPCKNSFEEINITHKGF